MANTEANTAIHHGTAAGNTNARNKPVNAAEPSQSLAVSRFIIRRATYSVSRLMPIQVVSKNTASQPYKYTLTIAAGIKAIMTENMVSCMLLPLC